MEDDTTDETVATKPEETAQTTEPHKEVDSTYHALSERVSVLEATVTSLLPQNRDETPVKKPWTHRGGK